MRALTAHVGIIVMPNERFDTTDVVMTEPVRNRRFSFIWNVGSRWVVATEHGGFRYNNPIFVYDLSQDGLTATLIREQVAFPNSVCRMASDLAILP